MEKIEPRLEKESYPDHIKVFRVRHGDTEYKEQLRGDIESTDLTEKGAEQIEKAAIKIATHLNLSKDIICVVSSPRKRTQDSAEIMRKYFSSNGFMVWDDPKNKKREIQSRVRDIDILNEFGQPMMINDPGYIETIKNLMDEINKTKPEGMSNIQYYLNNSEKISSGEKYDQLQKRVATQMRGFKKIAGLIQPKINKRIVIIELEHGETMDSMMEVVSQGKYTGKKGKEVQHAEVIEMTIPIKGSDIEVALLDRENMKTKINL